MRKNSALFIVTICLAFASLAACERARIEERSVSSSSPTYSLKDQTPVVLNYEKLIRSYRPEVILSALEQPQIRFDCYIVFTATLIDQDGKKTSYHWIDGYPDTSPYYIKLERLVFLEKKAFLEYTCIPTFSTDPADAINFRFRTDFFHGNPRLLVKYVRYKGTGSPKIDSKTHPFAQIFSQTYKWGKWYIWEEVSKEDFERAAQFGDVLSLNTIEGNGNNDFYSAYSHFEATRCYYGNRKAGGKEVDYYEYYRKRQTKDSDEALFFAALRNADTRKVEELLHRNPDLIRASNPDGLTALHLAVISGNKNDLLRTILFYKPELNVIDYRGRTPLKLVQYLRIERGLYDDLVWRGAKVLYDDCRIPDFKKRALKNKISRWLGDEVYQVFERYVPLGTPEEKLLILGRARIMNELGLTGAPDSDLSRKVDLILDNTHIHCSASEPDAARFSQYSLRICAPHLKQLVHDYDVQKKGYTARTGRGRNINE